jgi:hypothetical protein
LLLDSVVRCSLIAARVAARRLSKTNPAGNSEARQSLGDDIDQDAWYSSKAVEDVNALELFHVDQLRRLPLQSAKWG